MRITESHLRQIIRQTILEEQNRIDESSMMAQLKQAAQAALLAAGIATSPAMVSSMAKSMYKVHNQVTNQERISAHRHSVENEEGVDRLFGDYGQAINMFVTHHPTLHKRSQARKDDAVQKAEQALVDAGVSQDSIDAKFKEYLKKAKMYSY